MRGLHRALSLGLLGVLAACPTPPQQVEGAAAGEKPAAQASPDDPRVVDDDGDLYAVGAKSNPVEDPDAPAPGSGAPDETNGVCRLFAPRLPDPQCCPAETGFDVAEAEKACGLTNYLGESLQKSCGYFFAPDPSTKPVSIRVLRIATDKSAEAMAKKHDIHVSTSLKQDIVSEPIPGLEGAFWSRHEDMTWAFIPGWKVVRQVTWRDSFCEPNKAVAMLRQMVAAQEPADDAERVEILPTRRTNAG